MRGGRDRKCRNCAHPGWRHNPVTGECKRTNGCKCSEFDGRTEAEVVGQRMQVTDLSDEPSERKRRAWRVAGVLLESYGKIEPDHNISKYPTAFVATFVDMAHELLDSRVVVWHEHSDSACCPEHDHHVSPHRKCILR